MEFKKTSNLSSVTRTKSALLWAMMAVLFFSFSDRGYASVNEVNEIAAVSQQGRAVTGRIVDQRGEPVIGATVIEIGSSPINGTISNFDGEFTLNLTTPAPTLNVSFIGFEEMTVNVGNQSTINLVMQEYTSFLDEVVVIGYGTARRRDLTGAISTIMVDDAILAQAPRSVLDILRANAPGLHIPMSTTAEGFAEGILIRGDNSLLANSEPLIVLDGVIFQGGWSDINPADVASINILKDASSAAVFGSRAAGGVIAITTHRGVRGARPRITVNSNIGMVEVGPHRRRLMSPDEFLDFRSAHYRRHTFGPGWNNETGDERSLLHFSDPRLLSDDAARLAWFNERGAGATFITHSDMMREWGNRLNMGYRDAWNLANWDITDWEREGFQRGFQQQHNVSVTHRTEDMSVFWSMGYQNNQGFIIGDQFEVFRTRLNLEMTITPFLRVGMHSGFAARNHSSITAPWGNTNANLGNMTQLSPFAGNYIGRDDIPRGLWRAPSELSPTAVNPLFDRMWQDRRHWRNHLDANLFAVVSLPFNIEYQVNFTPHNIWREEMNHQQPNDVNWTPLNNMAFRQTWREFAWQVDNVLRWNETFGIHRFSVDLLANAERRQTWMHRMEGRQFEPNNNLGWHLMDLALDPRILSEDTYMTGAAFMGRLQYNLLDRYMFTTTFRRDGFSAFGVNNPWATFASFAAGWTFTSEQFAEPFNHIMDFGRLRLSWGENGNRDIPFYAALATIDWRDPIWYVNETGNFVLQNQARMGSLANPDLRWERTAAFNIGLDFAFFNSRLRGSFEYYDMMTNDLILMMELPDVTGFDDMAVNLGQIQNRGFEASLTYEVIRNQNFGWTTSGSFSLNRRQIVSLFGHLDAYGREIDMPGAGPDGTDGWWIGQDPSIIWQWRNDGVWQLHEAEMAARWGRLPGDMRYLPADGRIPQEGSVYSLTEEDRVFIGHRDPRFRWTWRNDFTFFRDWNVSMMMYSLWGHYGRFNSAANSGYAWQFTQFSQPFWTPENPTNLFGAPGSNNSGVGANIYRNRSFIRLQNVTVSYTVPRSIVQRLSVQNMRISASVVNPLVWSPHWTGWDPEVGRPTPRTYNLSLNFTL